MNSPIRSTPSSFSSQSCVWGRLSRASHSLLQARAKDLEDEMFYGPGFDPPVNNVIVPNIFNKLDAQCKERTRVMNNVLDKRLNVQERCILRNKDFQQRLHARQTAQIKEDMRKMSKRLPSFAKLYKDTDIALLEKQVKQNPVPLSKFSSTLPEERHHCFRYFEHHNPVRIARRVAEGIKKDLKRLERSMDANSVTEEPTAPPESEDKTPLDSSQSDNTPTNVIRENPDVDTETNAVGLPAEENTREGNYEHSVKQEAPLVLEAVSTETNSLTNPREIEVGIDQGLVQEEPPLEYPDDMSARELKGNTRKQNQRSRHHSSSSALT